MNRCCLLLVIFSGCLPHLYSKDAIGLDGDGEWTPPENDWPLSTPPSDLVGEGFHEGQVIPDFLLYDQFGDEVSLWQFYGSVLVVDISTMWCSPCQDLAEDAEETWNDFRDQGFVYVTILPEDVEGQPTEQADLVQWAAAFDLTAPVVGDPTKDWTAPAVPNGQYPVVLVVNRNMVVTTVVNPPSDAALRQAIEAAL